MSDSAPGQPLAIAAAQFAPVADKAVNLAAIADLVRIAAARDARRPFRFSDDDRPVGGADQAVHDAGLGGGMTGVTDDVQPGLGPGAVQGPGA